MVHIAAVEADPLSERRAATADRIADAALEILERDGLEGLTLKRLAARLGYAVGALYRYFGSKDELLVELERRVVLSFRDSLAAAAERARSTADEHGAAPAVASLAVLRAVVVGYADLADTAPAQMRLASLMLADPRQLLADAHGRSVMEALAPLLAEVRDLFDAAVEAGALASGDATERTLSLWAGLQGSLQLAKLARFEPERMEPRRRVEHLLQSLLLGWGARAEDLARARALEGEGR